MKKLEKITPAKTDFAKWYVDVITQADLMAYAQIKGTIYFKPNGFAIWENIVHVVDAYFKKQGIKNVYFPLLIPEAFIEKEKNHIKGFAPELLTVTHVGEKKLNEKIFLRPTSELLFADYFRNEIAANNNLPCKLNQWSQVLRWEKTTNPFLRNTEFLWQEGHTVHANSIEARKFAKKMIIFYKEFLQNYLAIPTFFGKKTNRERFAGAKITYTIESMMQNFRALQSATSHYLGQNFAKSFEIYFKNAKNEPTIPFQTSWGISTRLIGAIVMVHGDDNGLVLPPKIAPIQVNILEFFAKKNPRIKIFTAKVAKILKSKQIRFQIDDTDAQIGFKIANSEVHGSPLRIEIGPRDVQNQQVCLVRRDNFEKKLINIANLKNEITLILDQIQAEMLARATSRLFENTIYVDNYIDFEKNLEKNKFVIVAFDESTKKEAEIQAKTTATARLVIQEKSLFGLPAAARSLFSKKMTSRFVLFAKSY
ncbi:proline--tRNA ligase [Mycoplasma sp. 'Moose RK']|uniref:proline--tRNA ligase n=1 Tax=Mycoplasma sp. 'Moose RK' TaxID=2780095 RepID=UPI0018C24D7D|nr:proline--tRNA ligase [Mycoplasma sp. 'Moose RK']MBG0730682.1 proline--tRNA ligase [Mycoplasma sp. 'Moose RK']